MAFINILLAVAIPFALITFILFTIGYLFIKIIDIFDSNAQKMKSTVNKLNIDSLLKNKVFVTIFLFILNILGSYYTYIFPQPDDSIISLLYGGTLILNVFVIVKWLIIPLQNNIILGIILSLLSNALIFGCFFNNILPDYLIGFIVVTVISDCFALYFLVLKPLLKLLNEKIMNLLFEKIKTKEEQTYGPKVDNEQFYSSSNENFYTFRWKEDKEDLGNIVENENDNNIKEESGNTESASDQYEFSKSQESSKINNNNNSELDKKSENKNIKMSGLNPILEKQENKGIIINKTKDKVKSTEEPENTQKM